MDFLPSGSNKPNAEPPSRELLQSELNCTLKRSNLRQRCAPQDIYLQQASSSTNIVIDDINHSITSGNSGPPSLSEKYQSLTSPEISKPTVSIIVKGKEVQGNNNIGDLTPTSILKPVGLTVPLSRPHLHKTISFGDV